MHNFNSGINLYGCEIIPYQLMNQELSKEVLECRNHPNIRQFMTNPEPIPFENHIQFIENLDTKQKKYFAVLKNGLFFGAFNLHFDSEVATWGFFLNPNLMGSGLGVLLETIVLEISFFLFEIPELTGVVLEENKGALSLHKRFGFKKIDTFDGYHRLNLTQKDWVEQRTKILKIIKHDI